MDTQDRQAIEGLFGRLAQVEQQAGPRDTEAEGFIRDRVSRQPAAPYFMAQTIVVQEYALQEAQRRIEELERRPAGGGGFLSGLFGGGQSDNRSSTGSPYQSQRGPVPPMGGMQPGQGGMMQQGRGGGFLAGAAQTAMGVAGGLLLGNVIAGMFDGGGEANAAEPSAEPAAEPAADEGGGIFGGDEEY